MPLMKFTTFVLLDYHYEEDSDGNLVPAAGERTPGDCAKEVVATLKTLNHYVSIQLGRQRWNKENYLAACFEVLHQMGKLQDLGPEERAACERAKAIVDNRHDTPSPYDAPALFYNAASSPIEEDE